MMSVYRLKQQQYVLANLECFDNSGRLVYELASGDFSGFEGRP